jgi:hypothetical protein
MKRRIISIALLLVIVITAIAASGCASKFDSNTLSSPPVPAIAPAPAPQSGMPDVIVNVPESGKGTVWSSESTAEYNDGGTSSINRVIIRNGSMSVVAEDVLLTRDKIAALAQGVGGWVVSSEIHNSDENNVWGYITIRVPDGQFDDVVNSIRDYAVDVRSESSNSQDVTEEYIDLSGRLTNAKATEERYLALLDKAVNVEETLQVYEYLKRIQDEIEHLTGRIRYIEESAAMSLIHVEIQPERNTPLIEDGWRFSEVWRKAVLGLTTFARWLTSALVWVLFFFPVWGGIAAAVIITRRRRRKRQQTGG